MSKISVFLSHSSNDDEIVNEIVKILETQEIGCWIDHRNIIPGQNWIFCLN